MKIPFIDIQAAHGPIRAEMDAAIKDVLDRANFVMGEPVAELEKRMASLCGVPHAIGVASGTDALVIALRALGIGPGDAVITTPFTFIATAEAIHAVGARPVFCDIDPATYNLDPEAVRRTIDSHCRIVDGKPVLGTGETLRALLPVHLFGQAAKMDALLDIAKKYCLFVVEDAAQSTGAMFRIGGEFRMTGSIGDVACFSFYPSKNLGGVGDGGMVLTSHDDVAERVKILHLHGSKQKYHHIESGYNSRLDTLQAAVLGVKLSHLAGWLQARREAAEAYLEAFRVAAQAQGVPTIPSARMREEDLPDGPYIVLPSEDPDSPHTFNSFDIRVPRRDALVSHMQTKQIGCMVYYPVPLHLQKVYGYLGYHNGDMPISERVASDILAVSFYPDIPREYIQRVTETIVEFTAGSKSARPAS